MSKKIILVGGGGHCKSVLDSLLELNEYSKIGIIDIKENIGNSVMGIQVIGCDDNLVELFDDGYKYAFITLGSLGNPDIRIKLFNNISELGYIMPVIIDCSAKVSKYAKIEQGVFVGKLSLVNADASIQKCAIINSGSIVEHDCKIGAFVHIAPGAVLGGSVVIGENSHIGANATVKQNINIGSNTTIGMGSVVTKDIKSKIMAYGNPCCEVKTI